MILLRLHWWLMDRADRYDRNSYARRSAVFYWIGCRVASLWYGLFRRGAKDAEALKRKRFGGPVFNAPPRYEDVFAVVSDTREAASATARSD